jgi:hypothetical protein
MFVEYMFFCIDMFSDLKMTAALYTLPLLLPEACVAVKNKLGSRKRTTWKPSVIETMTYFIDIQKVDCFDAFH